MSSNPLTDVNSRAAGRVTREQIYDAVERYNKLHWVIRSGIPYTIGHRIDSDGIDRVFIDRK